MGLAQRGVLSIDSISCPHSTACSLNPLRRPQQISTQKWEILVVFILLSVVSSVLAMCDMVNTLNEYGLSRTILLFLSHHIYSAVCRMQDERLAAARDAVGLGRIHPTGPSHATLLAIADVELATSTAPQLPASRMSRPTLQNLYRTLANIGVHVWAHNITVACQLWEVAVRLKSSRRAFK